MNSHTHVYPNIVYGDNISIANQNFSSIRNDIYQVSDLKADKLYVDATASRISNLENIINNLVFKIQELERIGEEKMLESSKIINLYNTNRKADIQKRYEESINKIKEENEIVKKYKSLVNSFKASMMELYTSQFKEGQVESNVPSKTLAIVEYGNNAYKFDYILNESNYFDEEMEKVAIATDKETEELSSLIAAVSASVAICQNKEEIEEVLIRYEIIDKKTKKINLIEL